MNKILYLFFVITLIFSSCTPDNFETHESGLQYKKFTHNPEETLIFPGYVVTLKYSVFNNKNTLIEESGIFRIMVNSPSHDGGSVEDGLCLLHKNDSALFLINAKNYYNKTRRVKVPENVLPESDINFYVKIIDVITEDEFNEEQKAANAAKKFNEEELLLDYIKREDITTEPLISGIYIIQLKATDNPFPQPGQLVTVHYNGSFLNGQIFDSSYDRNEPFSFVLGAAQVIQGWEEGVARMRIGEKAKLIIPSHLAYGENGAGPIPPFTTLFFEIELLSAQ